MRTPMAAAALAVPLALALALALLVAPAGGGPQRPRPRRVHRDVVAAPAPAQAASPEPSSGGTELDMAAVAEVPAWRDLWFGSLDALHREPELNDTEEEVVAQLGSVAFLHCPVRHLGERGVSWVRRRDWHILSAGALMYTNDERFQVLHAEGSDDWVLQVKYVQRRDNGTYACQVAGGARPSARPLARLVHLRVAVPEAFILGADEHHVDAGSTISLVCIVDKSPVPPQYVFWYHNARMINYDAARGVTVATEPGPKTQSALAIRAAGPQHSGNYTCAAANAEPAHIYVYVSEGSDKMAATLSRSTGGAAPAAAATRAPLGAALLLLLLRRTNLLRIV